MDWRPLVGAEGAVSAGKGGESAMAAGGDKGAMQEFAHVVVAADSTRLFVRSYAPARRETGRTLIIVHGAFEHGGRYEHICRFFVERGWNVVVPDLRGHGRSAGTRTHLRDFGQYVDDLEQVRTHLSPDAESTALLGHSMGGLAAIRYAQCRPGRVAALAVTSPLLRVAIEIPRGLLAVGRLLSVIAPRWRFRSRVNAADTTRNRAVLEQRANDPLMQRTATAAWYFAMQRGVRSAWTEAHKLDRPLLVLQAGQDRIVDPAVVAPWLRTVAARDTRLDRFPEHLHELLNADDWQQTAGRIGDWLDQHCSERLPARSRRPGRSAHYEPIA